jgi:hypothetical protein
MTEAEIVEQLVEFQNVLLFGVSIYFTLVSAFVVALWAFLDEAGFLLKFFAWAFLTLVHAFLAAFFYGSAQFQMGLVASLQALKDSGVNLTPAGIAALGNAESGIDDWIRYVVIGVAAGFYLAMTILTFWNGWRKPAHLRVANERQ